MMNMADDTFKCLGQKSEKYLIYKKEIKKLPKNTLNESVFFY